MTLRAALVITRHSGLLRVTSLSRCRVRRGPELATALSNLSVHDASSSEQKTKIRRGLELVSCLKCVHPLFHEEEENCTKTFSDNPTETPPPKIQSLSTHPRADVKVGWSLEVHKTFLELRCKEKVLQHNWRRWSQQKNGSIEFVTSGLINVSGSPELEFNQIDLRRRYLHPQPTVQLVTCTQCEVGARQRF